MNFILRTVGFRSLSKSVHKRSERETEKCNSCNPLPLCGFLSIVEIRQPDRIVYLTLVTCDSLRVQDDDATKRLFRRGCINLMIIHMRRVEPGVECHSYVAV